MYMNFALATGLLITLPFTLLQIWGFLKPGLREVERKASLIFVPFAFLMFLIGLAFGYFVVFRMAFLFTTSIAQSLQLSETYGIAQYFSFMFNILIPIALVFELPIVVMFLTKIRLLNPKLLKKSAPLRLLDPRCRRYDDYAAGCFVRHCRRLADDYTVRVQRVFIVADLSQAAAPRSSVGSGERA